MYLDFPINQIVKMMIYLPFVNYFMKTILGKVVHNVNETQMHVFFSAAVICYRKVLQLKC